MDPVERFLQWLILDENVQYLINNSRYYRRMTIAQALIFIAAQFYFRGFDGFQYFNCFSLVAICANVGKTVHDRAQELLNNRHPTAEYKPNWIFLYFMLCFLVSWLSLLRNIFTIGVFIFYIGECILTAPVALYILWRQDQLNQMQLQIAPAG